MQKLLRKLNIVVAMYLAVMISGGFGGATYVLASGTSNFTQTISAGTLAVDIVDAAWSTVGSPTMAMTTATFGFVCQTKTGSFGTASEQVYISNPDAADNGWVVSLAGFSNTNTWDSAGTDIDFNDPTDSGCTDSGDAGDSVGGEMTVDASAGTLATSTCASCVTTNITKGSSDAFEEGVTDTITILTGAAGSDDIGDWDLQGITISQTIPAEQPAASDYDINMVLSIVAS